MKNYIRWMVSSLLVFTFLISSLPNVKACGPFIISPIFSLHSHADYPLSEFMDGKTGIVPTSFSEMSLFVFYRQLNKLSLTKNERKQISAAMENQIFYRSGINDSGTPDNLPDYLENWRAARAAVTGEQRDIETEKLNSGSYDYFSNCLPDAFNNATKTLAARKAKYGNDQSIKEWVSGQDAVFSNCEEKTGPPNALGADSPEWLRQDRDYQIAAAQFYMGDFDAARSSFEKISKDAGSPWKNTARFVEARAYIRMASFVGEGVDEAPGDQFETRRKELLDKAAEKLMAILEDDSIKEFHASAFRLLGLVKFRSIPDQRQKELAGLLVASSENQNLYNDLTDYNWLVNNIEAAANSKGSAFEQAEAEKAGKDYDYNYQLKLRDLPSSERADDLTDWLLTYQAADGFGHAFEKWNATGKLSWFVAAISKTDPKSEETGEILKQAEKIKPDSPAFATVRYHQIRILLENEKRVEAKKKLDEIIAGNLKDLPISTQNRFLAQRMTLAANIDDFIKYAPRRAAIFDWDETGREEGTSLKGDEYLSKWEDKAMFDDDSVAFLNEKVPLATLREAAMSKQLPEHLKKFLVVAVWTRAFILGNQAIEREFTPMVSSFAKEFSPLFSKYERAKIPADREAAAMLVILGYPIIQPYVPVGFGREDSTASEIDSIRGNWWCAEDESSNAYSNYDNYQFQYPRVYPDFLTANQKTAAKNEHLKMISLGNSATFLARRAVEFANKNPRHSQTPELLHWAVRSTRYGCKDESTGTYSKQAFDILHKRYGASPWTKQTPYWFKQ